MVNNDVELIYSSQDGEYIKGRSYSNPRFFTTPRRGVKKVFIVGHWPKVERAYKSIGVPVEHLDYDGQPMAGPAPEEVMKSIPQETDYSHIEIQEDWQQLPWVGLPPTIRSLASKLTDTTVLNKAQAVSIISAELARRHGI